MFAQQLMNRHNMANEPMGILASSPQLMNAAQGFKDGGEVKGYKAGGGSFLNNFLPESVINALQLTKESKDKVRNTALEEYKTGATDRYKVGAEKAAQFNAMELPGSMFSGKISGILAAHPEVTFDENKKMFVPKESPSTVEANIGETKSLDQAINEKEKTDIEGDNTLLKKLVNEKNKEIAKTNAEITVDDFGGLGREINESNVNGNVVEPKEEPKEEPKVTKKKDSILGNVHSELKGLVGKQDALLKQITDSEKAPKINNDFANRIKKMEELFKKKGKEVNLDDIDKEARKMAGIDETSYDEDKHTAFWMGLIKGGLATAAGESSNAMTNIAKGLGFGVKSYAEDISVINKEERADMKELAKIRMKLVDDKRSEALAYKTMELQYQGNILAMENSREQFESTMDFNKKQASIKNQMSSNMFDLSVATTRADLKVKEATMEINQEKLDLSVDQFKQNLNFQISKMKTPAIGLEVLGLGANYATVDQGALAEGRNAVTLTPLGENLARTLLSGKYKGSTDKLTRMINQASESSSFLGVDFKTPADAQNAVLTWYSAYEGAFTRAKGDIQSATTDTDEKARESVKNSWIKTLSGVVTKEGQPPPNKKSVIQSINKV